MSLTLRTRAAATVRELTPRLADVHHVACVLAQTPERRPIDAPDVGADSSASQSLHGGYPALAVCFAELGHVDTRWRLTGHRYLQLALQQGDSTGHYGQLDGLSAVATAASISARSATDYATLLLRLDDHVIANARRLVALQKDVQDHGLPTRPVLIDTLYGLAGVGRQLLARSQYSSRAADAFQEVLRQLVALRRPLYWQGEQVPGWWYRPSEVVNDTDEDDLEHGFAGFGLSHGVAGPLALLALAWQAGARVDGQSAAIETIVEWLLTWCEHSDDLYWPAWISLAHHRDPSQARPQPSLVGWCHGSLGVAHAIALAADALGSKHWTSRADEVVGDVLRTAGPDWSSVREAGLCHGMAGLLYQLSHLSWRNSEATDLDPITDQVAQLLLDRYDPDAPFGFQHHDPHTGRPYDIPGLFEGSAGILLALHAYATAQPPATGWDRILMLS